MTKKRIIAVSAVLSLALLIFQIWSIQNIDPFKEKGGIRIIAEIAPGKVLTQYANKTAAFEEIFEKAKQEAKKEKIDLFNAFAQVNERLSGKPLIHLFNHRNIPELGLRASDEEVLMFLRSKYDLIFIEAQGAVNKTIEATGTSCHVVGNSKTKKMTIEVAGARDEASLHKTLTAQSQIAFYEVKGTMSGNGSQEWQNLYEALEGDRDPKDSVETELDDEALYSFEEEGNDEEPRLKQMLIHVVDRVIAVSKQNRPKVEAILASIDITKYFGKNSRILWSLNSEDLGDQGECYMMYVVKVPENGRPYISNADIKSAYSEIDEVNGINVMINMTQEGADKWAEMTAENINRIIAICLNDEVVSAPMVIAAIQNGTTQIAGDFKKEEAALLANQINMKTGSYNINIVNSEIIKPSLEGLSSSNQWLLIWLNIFVLVILVILLVVARRTTINEI